MTDSKSTKILVVAVEGQGFPSRVMRAFFAVENIVYMQKFARMLEYWNKFKKIKICERQEDDLCFQVK